MTSSPRTLARALSPIFEGHIAKHVGGDAAAFREAADAVVAAANAFLDVGDDDAKRRLRRTAHETSLHKSEAIMAGAAAAAAVLDAGLMLLSGLEDADIDDAEARYSIAAALVALADADVEQNETLRAGCADVVDRDAALVPLRAAFRARVQGMSDASS